MLRVAAIGTAKRKTASKRKTMLRFARPPLRFESYAVTISTICVYVFKFWEMLRLRSYTQHCFELLHVYIWLQLTYVSWQRVPVIQHPVGVMELPKFSLLVCFPIPWPRVSFVFIVKKPLASKSAMWNRDNNMGRQCPNYVKRTEM